MLIETIIERDATFHAWLSSSKFYDNLEELYMLHLPSQTEWKEYLQVVYHDFLVNNNLSNSLNKVTAAHKNIYEKNFSEVEAMFQKRLSLIMKITSSLMDERPRNADNLQGLLSGESSNQSTGVVPQQKFY